MSHTQKALSLVGSVALAAFTLGIVHLICRKFLYDQAKNLSKNPTEESSKVNRAAGAVLPAVMNPASPAAMNPAHSASPAVVNTALPGLSAASTLSAGASTLQAVSPVKEYLGGTSDHSWKTYEVEFRSESAGKSFGVKIGTWNLMDRCFKPETGYANNPLNHTESDEEYLARKREQIEEIRTLITGGAFEGMSVKNVSALVFQEVDFWSNGSKADFLLTTFHAPIQEWQEPFHKLYLEFKEMLHSCGWDMLTTDPKIAKADQDPMIMIYDPKCLKPQGRFLEGCFQQPSARGGVQNRGAQQTFLHRGTNKPIVIANLHLNYAVAPQEAIEKYQAEQLSRRLPTIALGDLNRTPNKQLDSSIADWKFPTNVDASTVADRGNPEMLTVKDGDNPRLNKAYDAALVNPGGRHEKAIITESEMAYFEKKEKEPGFKLAYANIKRRHEGIAGYPWMRNKKLLNILEAELKLAVKGSPTEARLLAQVAQVKKHLGIVDH